MKPQILLVLGILAIVFVAGCTSQTGRFTYNSEPNIVEVQTPARTYIEIPDISKIPWYKDLDCADPKNFNITYVKVRDFSDLITYNWYPSLNEGRIDFIYAGGKNMGCTKIAYPAIAEIYIVRDNEVLFYDIGNSGTDSYGGNEWYGYPGDDVLAIPSNPGYFGVINLIVKEKGKYQAIIIVRDRETNRIIGGREEEFEIGW